MPKTDPTTYNHKRAMRMAKASQIKSTVSRARLEYENSLDNLATAKSEKISEAHKAKEVAFKNYQNALESGLRQLGVRPRDDFQQSILMLTLALNS